MKINFSNDKTCTTIGLIVNFFLTVGKFLVGILGKSQTLIADALHSLSDEIATIIVYLSLHLSQKPADKNHPYGHGNIEVISAIFVSFLILITGIFLGYSAIHILIHKHYSIPKTITIYAAIISIIVKELLFRYTFLVGKKLNSPVITANAYHHRSDAFSSVGALFAIIATKSGVLAMDAIGSIIISIFIFKMGIDILKENMLIIMDTLPSEKMKTEIDNLIASVNGVENSYSTRIHRVGRHFFIETEIEVDKDLTLEEAHNIAEEVKKILKSFNPQIKEITVHVEPRK
ncbi:MAG: cation diffusion facilitator family transporter [Endomicrobiia bacterium]